MASFLAKIILGVVRNTPFWRASQGNVHVIMTLALVPIIGALGMAAEGANWWLTQRAAQNAADTAVMSASWNGGTTAAGSGSASSYATTGCTASPGAFDCEAVGAAARTGFTNGSGNAVVYPQYLTNATTPACPNSLTSCYKVSVIRTMPVYLLGLALNGRTTQNVRAVAYAALINNKVAPDCLLGLGVGVSGDTLLVDGGPNANLAGCDIQIGTTGTTATATCHGHNLNADAVFTTGADNNCGNSFTNGAPGVVDPYASLASSIPADPCANGGMLPSGVSSPYPQGSGASLPNVASADGSTIWGAKLSGPQTWGSTEYLCGNVQLSGNVTLNSNTTLVIYNGQLNLNGNTIQTASGFGNTVVFAGSNTFTYNGVTTTPNHAWSTSGTLDIDSPTSGTWSGMAVYQSPSLTSGVNVSAAGNSPTMLFTGVVYQPNASDTFSGAIDHSSNGVKCFVWVFNQMHINGTASIFQGTQSQCRQAGVTQVFSTTPVHELIQ